MVIYSHAKASTVASKYRAPHRTSNAIPKGSHPAAIVRKVQRVWLYRDKRDGSPIGAIDARKMARKYGHGASAIIERVDNVRHRADGRLTGFAV